MPKPVSALIQLALTAVLGVGAYGVAQNFDQVQAMLGLTPPQAPERSDRAEAGVPVIVAEVDEGRDDVRIEVVGTGRALRSVMLRSEEAGRVTEMSLAANARFAEGDVLLRLDDTKQQLALKLAQARLDEAERVTARLGQLQGTGAVTAARFEEAQTAEELAWLEVEQAAQAVEDRVLRAPFDGVAGLPAIEPGDWVESNSEIAAFDDRSSLEIEVDLPEGLVSRVKAGLVVEATTPAFPARLFEGRVAAMDSRIDPQSRTAKVRIALPNPDDVLRPGASFTVRFFLPGEVYAVIPELAIQFAREGLHVWRATAEGTAEQVEVRLVRRRGGEVLVEGDLSPGDRVVVEGTQRLRPGRAISLDAAPVGGGA
jgi:RND family efflux transporter MFP subunit